MKAIGFLENGGPEVLKLLDLAEPTPKPGEVIIQTQAVGLNFADIYRRRGEYSAEGPSPYVLGHEGAGIVHAIGEQVEHFAIGDRVAFAHVPRANAEFIAAPSWKVVPLPEFISYEVAASVMLQGLTAHYLTHDSYQVQPGDIVLIHSASGGVGLLLIQICKLIGARTIGTVSTFDKISAAKNAGADHVLVRSHGDWKKSVLEFTNGEGVHAAYDGIGSTLEETLSVVQPKGTAVYFGWSGGKPPKIDPNTLMSESKRLVGGELWSHIADRKSLLKRSEELFFWINEGKLNVQIFGRYPLSKTREAHELLESGLTTGKLLLTTNMNERSLCQLSK